MAKPWLRCRSLWLWRPLAYPLVCTLLSHNVTRFLKGSWPWTDGQGRGDVKTEKKPQSADLGSWLFGEGSQDVGLGRGKLMITRRVHDWGQMGSQNALSRALHCLPPQVQAGLPPRFSEEALRKAALADCEQAWAATAALMGTWPGPRRVWKAAVGSCKNPWSRPVFPQREIHRPEEMPSPVPSAKLEENQVERLPPLPGWNDR